STAQDAPQAGTMASLKALSNDEMSPLINGTVNAVEEAIVNALVAAKDMKGTEGRYAKAIDHEALRALLKQYGRLGE
ncbi:MAG TPA: P1 family peptidase, partial [Parvularculaceae bacterium]|nr:P1 family peptidase [Parvularculaceae bacterium]